MKRAFTFCVVLLGLLWFVPQQSQAQPFLYWADDGEGFKSISAPTGVGRDIQVGQWRHMDVNYSALNLDKIMEDDADDPDLVKPRFQQNEQLEAPVASIIIPEGWRMPNESDYKDDWQYFRNEFPIPYHIDGDFNGDGLLDQAWILIRSDSGDWRLYAFLNQGDQSFKAIKLIEAGQEMGEYSGYGISIVTPGEYKTACGKGYGDCGEDEVDVLTLESPAIDFRKFESYNVFYYWDFETGNFNVISMSD